jgi:molecular chaperone HtpG
MHLQHILRQAGHDVPVSRPTLEINAGHALVRRLEEVEDEAQFSDWSHVLFDQALLAEGGQLEDPAGFVSRLNGLLLKMTSGE